MTERRLVLTERPSPDARCAFCHDDLDADTFECPQCQTKLHADCADNIPECPTLGCRRSLVGLRSPGERRPRPTRAACRQALLNLVRRDPDPARAALPPPEEAPREGGWASEEEGVPGPALSGIPPRLLLLLVAAGGGVVIVLAAIVRLVTAGPAPGIEALFSAALASLGLLLVGASIWQVAQLVRDLFRVE